MGHYTSILCLTMHQRKGFNTNFIVSFFYIHIYSKQEQYARWRAQCSQNDRRGEFDVKCTIQERSSRKQN